jgi:Septum formation
MTAGAVLTAVLLVVAIPLVVGCAGDDEASSPSSSAPSSTATARPTSLYDLEVGDCFRGLAASQDLRVRPVRCGRGHQAEVYGVVELTNRRFPGVETLRIQAATACAQRFTAYTGEPPGPGLELAFTEVVPTLASWASGDRTALCLALGPGGAPLTGTIAIGGEGA